MSIYAIGDLHLSFAEDKPMDVFGENWTNHEEKIKENWVKNVKQNDYVILPGDFSWAMHLKDAVPDFEYLNGLPGNKILIKGNHDYWWETVTKMDNFLAEKNIKDIHFLNCTAFEHEKNIIVGTKGYNFGEIEKNEKLRNREFIRLSLSIKYAKENFDYDNSKIICALHYPPITKNIVKANQSNEFIDLLRENNIHKCIYAHLHGRSFLNAFNGTYKGIEFDLVSSDFLNFNIFKVV